MLQCTQIIHFDAAHRIIGHAGKCRKLHGHRYTVEATFSSATLDVLDMVMDFGIIKYKLQDWINTHWDHNTILSSLDHQLGESIRIQTGQNVYYLNSNPTAEGMCDYLLNKINKKIFLEDSVDCRQVKLYETPNCYATATLQNV